MRRLLTEPLLHFLLVGAVVFAAFALLRGEREADPGAIVVSAGRIDQLRAIFTRTWQRPPTRLELEGLIQDYLREEVAYREGMAMGLDRDDTIIRRRVRQKFDFIAEDVASRVAPTDADLAAYLAIHAEDFRVPPHVSFRQIYLDPTKRGEAINSDAARLLEALNGDAAPDAALLGDRTMLEFAYADVSESELTNLFGPEFATTVSGLAHGLWHGPIASAYGEHLVVVDRRSEGGIPALDEVRERVLREWEHEHGVELSDGIYRSLLAKYTITIEWPPDTRGGSGQ